MALEITIDQNEIDTAIKNHIHNLISVREGQEIRVSLKAGRGENGFSATIEIGEVKAAEPEAATASPVTATPPFRRERKPAAIPATDVAQEAGETATTTETEAQATDTASEAAPATEEATDAPAPKAGLFGHLGKRVGTE